MASISDYNKKVMASQKKTKKVGSSDAVKKYQALKSKRSGMSKKQANNINRKVSQKVSQGYKPKATPTNKQRYPAGTRYEDGSMETNQKPNIKVDWNKRIRQANARQGVSTSDTPITDAYRKQAYSAKSTNAGQVNRYDQGMAGDAINLMKGTRGAAAGTRDAALNTTGTNFDITNRMIGDQRTSANETYKTEADRMNELYNRGLNEARYGKEDALFGINQNREATNRRYDTAISDIKSGIDKDLADVRQRMARQGVLPSSFARDEQQNKLDSTYRGIADLERQRGQELDTINRESYQLNRDYENNIQQLSSDQQYQLQKLNQTLDDKLRELDTAQFASAEQKQAAEQQIVAQYFQNLAQVDQATAQIVMQAATLEQQKNQFEASQGMDIAKLGLQEQQMNNQNKQNQFANQLAMSQFSAGREDAAFNQRMAERQFGLQSSQILADNQYRQQAFEQGVKEFGLSYALQQDAQNFGQDMANKKLVQDAQMFMRGMEQDQAQAGRDERYRQDTLGLQRDQFNWEKENTIKPYTPQLIGQGGSPSFLDSLKSGYQSGGLGGAITGGFNSLFGGGQQNNTGLSPQQTDAYNAAVQRGDYDTANQIMGLGAQQMFEDGSQAKPKIPMPSNPEQYIQNYFNDPNLTDEAIANKAHVAAEELGGTAAEWESLFRSQGAQPTAIPTSRAPRYEGAFTRWGRTGANIASRLNPFNGLAALYAGDKYKSDYNTLTGKYTPRNR